jgi:hypothetical protein
MRHGVPSAAAIGCLRIQPEYSARVYGECAIFEETVRATAWSARILQMGQVERGRHFIWSSKPWEKRSDPFGIYSCGALKKRATWRTHLVAFALWLAVIPPVTAAPQDVLRGVDFVHPLQFSVASRTPSSPSCSRWVSM